ncbi:MAG TPA: hypothetical protein EYQ06_04235 [Flavobacteriales bacterium]|jgi:tetratricopeptide (TPR) repeat protein|nr:hypothetical protein [Flavobacteriales bacterium]
MSVFIKNILFLLIFLIPFIAPIQIVDNPLQADPGYSKLIFSIFFITLIALFWLRSLLVGGVVIVKSEFYLPIAGFLLWNLLSFLWVDNLYLAIVSFSLFLFVAIFFFLFVQIAKTIDIKKVTSLVSYSLLGVAIIGLLQYYFDDVAIIRDFFWQSGKPSSTFSNKNMASHFVVMSLPLTLGLFAISTVKKQTYTYSVIFFIGSWFLMYASARQAYLASIVQIIVIISFILIDYLKNKEKSFILITNLKKLKFNLVILCVSLLFIVSNLTDQGWSADADNKSGKIERVIDIADTNNERIPGWLNTIEIIKDNFFIGTGAGQWQEIYPTYIDRVKNDIFIVDFSNTKRLHNDYLEVFSNVGFIGFLFLLWIFWVAVKNTFSILIDADHQYRILLLSISLGLIGFLVVAFVSFPIRVYLPIFIIMLYIGVINLASKSSQMYKFKNINKYKFIFFAVPISAVLLLYSLYSLKWLYAESHYIKSTIFENDSKFDLALAESKKSINLNEYNALYWLSVGRNLLKQGNAAESLKYLKRGVLLSPNNKKGLLDLSNAYRKLSKIDLEEEVLVDFLNIYPNDVNALARMTRVLIQRNNLSSAKIFYEKMKSNFERIKGRAGFFPFHKEVAEIANIFKDYQYISYVYKDMIGNPWYVNNANDYAVLATIEFFRLGNKDEGIKLYKKARKIDKNVKLPNIIVEAIEQL